MKRLILLLLACIPLTYGCVFEDTTGDADGSAVSSGEKPAFLASVYEPLKTGSVWYYGVSWEEEGVTYRTIDYTTVIGFKEFEGRTYREIQTTKDYNTFFARTYSDYLRIDGNMLLWGGGSSNGTEYWSVHDMPVENFNHSLDDRWIIEIGENYTHTAKFESFDNITVPAGTFHDCVKVKSVISYNEPYPVASVTTVWLAPGVGAIKRSDMTIVNGSVAMWQTSELLQYTIP